MIDKTLKGKIARYNKLCAEYDAIKTERDKLRDSIIAEYDARAVDTFGGLRVINMTRETVSKKNCPRDIWDKFKTVNNYRYLKKCNA